MGGGSRRWAWTIQGVFFACVAALALSPVVPLTYDEAWTFIEFSRFGVVHAVTHYPLPNNHVAFSALQAILVPNAFVAANPVLLRVANLGCVAALLWLVGVFLRRATPYRGAALGSGIVAVCLCSPLFTLYLFLGRGYLLGAVLLLAAVHAGALRGRRFAAAGLCALATWTVPTFAYATPGVLLALGTDAPGTREHWRAVALSAAVYGALTAALYLPIAGEVFGQRAGWNLEVDSALFVQQLWSVLGNFGAFRLTLAGGVLVIVALAAALAAPRSESSRDVAFSLLAPVASFLFVAGLLTATGLTATPFVRTASFVPLFVWLAVITGASHTRWTRWGSGGLLAFNAFAGLLLFLQTVGFGDPQRYPLFAELNPSPLGRADPELVRKARELELGWDAVPVGRLYARTLGFRVRTADSVPLHPCAQGGRFAPAPRNRIAIGEKTPRLLCF